MRVRRSSSRERIRHIRAEAAQVADIHREYGQLALDRLCCQETINKANSGINMPELEGFREDKLFCDYSSRTQ